MDKNLAVYIWRHTSRQQIWILFIILLSMPTYFLSLDLPKQIVNGPIQGDGFNTPDAQQTFLKIVLDLPDWLGKIEPVVLFEGFHLSRFGMLMALSAAFLLLVVVNGLFKFYINTFKGRLGERMLRRLRFQLIDRVLRFPPNVFKRVKASEVATMVKDEVEPLGGFIGDAFVQPAFLGMQAGTALFFIVLQNFWLGILAAFMVGIQGIIIPKMRRRLIRLGKERQLTARQLAGRVGEIVDGISSIHVHDTSNYERADIASRLGRIFKIRYDLYQWKFFVKFLNNFLAQVTPFLFYAIGGYLALRGQLDIGQLVAVISAYKDLPSPIKDLIDWDQQRLDVQVKYAQVYEQFHVDQLIDPAVQALASKPATPIETPISIYNFSASDDSGARLLENITLDIRPGENVAVIGTAGGGTEALADAIARLVWPENGRISVNGADLLALPEAVTGRRIAYAAGEAHLFQGTIYDNLVYVLKHYPVRHPAYEGTLASQREWEVSEAQRAGNPDHDLRSDWIDYETIGAKGPEDLSAAVEHVLEAVSFSDDVFDLGLRASLDEKLHPAIPRHIVEARKALQTRLDEEGLSGLVASFDLALYNTEATVAENLLFGTPVGPELSNANLAANAYFRSILTQSNLDEALYRMGVEIARNAVELFRDLPPDHPFFQQLIFMTADEIPDYQALLQRVQDKPFAAISEADRRRMMKLTFSYVEPRYRFGLLDDGMMERIVQARMVFHDNLPDNLKGAIELYDPEGYNKSASILDNVLFGRVGHRHADAGDRIRGIVRAVLDDLDLSQDVMKVGLEFNVGVGGRRLTTVQRQKLHVARALLKRGDFIILNKALSSVEQRTQEQLVRSVLGEAARDGRKPAVIWVLSNPNLARLFDRVVVLDRGVAVEDGNYDHLMSRKGVFAGLLAS
ncbi:ABC transporter transmembrane domain-containing protein [Taklimakanibacter lacteus]|uniref:ABC transporter transmembrane domain-containing protein n=1 Tax=Taklimakanibacter lacteus TaxID=2268456 RepID=UPI000E660026